MSSFYYVEPTESQRLRGNRFNSRFIHYGAAGLLDPKMPVEAYVFGTGSTAGIFTLSGWRSLGIRGFAAGAASSVGMAVLGAGLIGAIFDPLEYNEGGLDDHIPIFRWKTGWNRFELGASQVHYLG